MNKLRQKEMREVLEGLLLRLEDIRGIDLDFYAGSEMRKARQILEETKDEGWVQK